MEEFRYKISRMKTKEDTDALACFEKVVEYLEKNVWVRAGEFNAREIEFLNPHNLITAKKVVYLINLSKKDFLVKQCIISEKEKQMASKDRRMDKGKHSRNNHSILSRFRS